MRPFLMMYGQMSPADFSKAIAATAPYFATIAPDIRAYRHGYCELHLENQRKVHNHLGTIHAIAMCNAAELVAGLATDASLPDGARWIPQGMTVQYLAKAKTDLRVVCDASDVDFSQGGAVTVSVAAYNADDDKCFTADIIMNIKLA